MKRVNRFLQSRKSTILMTIAAVILLIASGVGVAQARLGIISETYSGQVNTQDIGITLIENGDTVAYRNYDSNKADGTWKEKNPGVLLSDMVTDSKKLVFEKEYPEVIEVKNSGAINVFARVSIIKYWTDKDGNRMTTLTPELIDLNVVNTDKWIKDTSDNTTTRERSVYYYSKLLEAGETTPPLTDTISISNEVAKKVTQTQTGNKIVTTYDYDGVQFHVEAYVDAVQEHNAQEAVKSAWGRSVTVNGTSLSLD